MEFFSRNFENSQEQKIPVTASVTGCVPNWLKGDLLRVGPAKFDITEDFSVKHWFDGYSMLHKFSFKDGKVTFMKKFLESDAYKKAMKIGKPIFTEFGTKAYPDPTKSLFSRMLSTFDSSAVTDNACLNVMNIAGETFVSSETCYLRRVDSKTLETKEKIDLHKIAGVNFATSHVLEDDDGNYYNIGMTMLSGPKYHIIKTGPSNNNHGKDVFLNTRILTTIPSSWKGSYSYIHSFSLTDNYLIFLEQPLIVNTFKLATSQVKGRSLRECMEWHPEELVKFIVVNKNTGEVVKTKYITNEAFFVLHHINAYEKDGQVILDLATYSDCEVMDNFFLDKVRNCCFSNLECHVKRFIIPIVDDVQSIEIGEELVRMPGSPASAMRYNDNQKGDIISLSGVDIGKLSFDLPVINNHFKGKPYRFVYGTGGVFAPGSTENAITKTDVETGEEWIWRGNSFQYPSEPVFIPRPHSTVEDDGVILSCIVESRPDQPHSLLVLDAGTFTELARVDIPSSTSIPVSLHGIFIAEENSY